MVISAVTGFAVLLILMLLEYKFTIRMLIAAAISAVCIVPGSVFGELLRKLTYGEWLDIGSLIGNFSDYEGTHYAGQAIYIISAGLILWRIVMRKRDGSFARGGQTRYMSMLAVFMNIQIVIGRIGCLKEGCCQGAAYYGPLSVMSPTLGYRVYPAVHTELIIAAVTLAVVTVLYIKRRNAFSVFCIGYALALFIAEFMYDNTGTVKIAGLTVVQILAVIIAAVGIIYKLRKSQV